MSYEKVLEYLDKLEAIQNYKKVVQENLELKEDIKKSNRRYFDASLMLMDVSEREKRLIKYNRKEYSIKKFDELVKAEVKKEVEAWKDWEMKSEIDKRWKKKRSERIKVLEQEFDDGVNQRISEVLDVLRTAGLPWLIWNDPVAFSAS